MKKIVFLVSGNGGNLKFLFKYLNQNLNVTAKLFCIADRDCGALLFCEHNNITSIKINYSRTETNALQETLASIKPDIIITNWHKIIDVDTVDMYRGKFVNLHYSLLPAFSGLIGLAPIDKSFAQNCKFTGATCHYVDEGVDTGEIISQATYRTDISIPEAYEKTFRAGCIILLDSIMSILGYKSTTIIEQYDNVFFSPALSFDLAPITEELWMEVKGQ